MIKPFNKQLHDENDPKSRKVILEHFKSKGLNQLIENPDIYGIDLVLPSRTLGIELERHAKWLDSDKEYIYQNIHILSRKKHLFQNESMDVMFIVLNYHYSKATYLWKSTIQKYLTNDYMEHLKCYVPGHGWRYDDVYNVPRRELKYINLI